MSAPRVFDSFMFAGTPVELDLLECRLEETYDALDHVIVVEARVDHQDHPKELAYLEHEQRFAPWKDKIHYVIAEDLPTAAEFPPESNPWIREHAQREYTAQGLKELDAAPDDIVLHGDLDEIPRSVVIRNARPQGNNFIGCHMAAHFFAIDWRYPPGWNGTVAARVETALATGFGPMRDKRNFAMRLPNAGWHFSWLGGMDAWMKKVGSFCHPEVKDRIVAGGEKFWADGIHVDMVRMEPCEVDKTYPKWMLEPGNVPASWRRPRG